MPDTIGVPNLIGLTQSAAEEKLKEAGLVVGTVRTVGSATTRRTNVNFLPINNALQPRGKRQQLLILRELPKAFRADDAGSISPTERCGAPLARPPVRDSVPARASPAR
jgi:hypothetical protein